MKYATKIVDRLAVEDLSLDSPALLELYAKKTTAPAAVKQRESEAQQARAVLEATKQTLKDVQIAKELPGSRVSATQLAQARESVERAEQAVATADDALDVAVAVAERIEMAILSEKEARRIELLPGTHALITQHLARIAAAQEELQAAAQAGAKLALAIEHAYGSFVLGQATARIDARVASRGPVLGALGGWTSDPAKKQLTRQIALVAETQTGVAQAQKLIS